MKPPLIHLGHTHSMKDGSICERLQNLDFSHVISWQRFSVQQHTSWKWIIIVVKAVLLEYDCLFEHKYHSLMIELWIIRQYSSDPQQQGSLYLSVKALKCDSIPIYSGDVVLEGYWNMSDTTRLWINIPEIIAKFTSWPLELQIGYFIPMLGMWIKNKLVYKMWSFLWLYLIM